MKNMKWLIVLILLAGCQTPRHISRRDTERKLWEIKSENPNAFRYILSRIEQRKLFNEEN